MRIPLPNLILAAAGVFLTLVGIGVHPNVVIVAFGALLSLTAILFRFSERKRRQP